MTAENCVTIYGLYDPGTKECRYIGKTKDLTSRIRNHRWEARDTSLHTHKVNWLRSLACDPLVEVLQQVSIEDWQDAERKWIREMREQGVNLTNFADGGQTSPVEGRGHTEESKAKMRESALRHGNRPPIFTGHSRETRNKMSATHIRIGTKPPMMGGWNKGKKMSIEYIEKNRAGHIGIPWSALRRKAQENKKLEVN